MQHMMLKISAIVALTVSACSENNPYKDQQVGLAKNNSKQTEKLPSDTSTHSEKPEEQGVGDLVVEPIKTEVADVKNTAPAELNVAQLICDDKEYAAKYPVEMGVFCVEGKPSTNLINALNSPYRGQGDPVLKVIQQEDIDGVSNFLIVSSIEINKGQKEAYAIRELMNSVTTAVPNNATMRQRQLLSLAPAGNLLSNYEIDVALDIQVGGITVDDHRIAMRDYATLKEGAIIKSANYLKAGVEDNEEKLSNIISFWVSNGNKTRIVGVTRQQTDNRGRHEIAVRVVQGLGKQALIDTVAAFNK